MTARRTISNGAALLLRHLARRAQVSERVYLEALLHYAGSIERRPGSWEASRPFDLATYTAEDSPADRWFDAQRQYAFGDPLGPATVFPPEPPGDDPIPCGDCNTVHDPDADCPEEEPCDATPTPST